MEADSKKGMISIELTHPDEGIRLLMFEQFEQLRVVLRDELGEEWLWDTDFGDPYGKRIACIYTLIEPVNVFKKDDWPQLISFFKPRMIALDSFWSMAKYSFDIFK